MITHRMRGASGHCSSENRDACQVCFQATDLEIVPWSSPESRTTSSRHVVTRIPLTALVTSSTIIQDPWEIVWSALYYTEILTLLLKFVCFISVLIQSTYGICIYW